MTPETGRNNHPDLKDRQIQHLQERMRIQERELDEALGLLRIFGREHTHAEIAPRSAFARAAEMVMERA